MIQKQPVSINFAQGLDQKSDPWAIPVGKFYALNNRIFTKAGLLEKRNGFGQLASLPNTTYSYLSTFGKNLTAVGDSIAAYNQSSNSWVTKGNYQPISLNVLPTVRSALSQIQCDSVIADNGLVCTVFTETNAGSKDYKYVIADSTTGQNIVTQTLIPSGSGAVSGSPRVFLLGAYFIIVYTNTISAVAHLQYVAISSATPTIVSTPADIAASYIPATTVSWDGVVTNNKLYIAYNTTSGGQHVAFTYLSTAFDVASPTTFAGSTATVMSVTADNTGSSPVIYAAFWDSGGSTGHAVAVDSNLNKLMTATEWLATGSVANVTSVAQNRVLTILYENVNNYSYGSGIPSNFISQVTVTLPATVTTGTVGSPGVVLRSVGLASKAFLFNGSVYTLAEYSSDFQPTYFLIDLSGHAISRFAYENGGGYLTLGLPQAQVIGSVVTVPYLYKDLITSVNKAQGAANAAGVYSQTGVNLASLSFSSEVLSTAEIGNDLNISGGFLYSYDGNTLSEQNFHLWPDNIEATWSETGGNVDAQPDGSTNMDAYFYQVIYQWTDAQGNIFNSAPSIPIAVTTTGSGTSGSITVDGPMIRITDKTDVKIVIYRWSVAQEEYFQVTSLSAPLLNDPTMDSWEFVDTLDDASIAGNGLIYTTGGVIENVSGPACTALTLFDTRLWLIDAEDQNLLWYSKQVIEATPVEMSDDFTFYVAPNVGSTSATGPMKCIFPMDDKLIIFKKDAMYYLNGSGPDNTGTNSQYSQPIFITSTVGSANQNSIVFIPQGLMFQSDKGIWLLGRDLSTSYIGAPVENTNNQTVTSAVVIPGTTQVRFTLSNGTALMYDYFYGQWGTFTNLNAISSTLYQNLHTYISPTGSVSQETPGVYLDNGNPVLTSLTTGWLNMAGLQGYMRAYTMFILGRYLSPHKLEVGIAYNYNSSTYQKTTISPTNFSSSTPSPFGDEPAPFEGSTRNDADVESWRVFLARQRCSSFQVTINEIYDPSFGVQAGAGLTLSGLNFIVGIKSGFRTTSSGHTAGGGVNIG